ncbi:DeoR/GlpR family DNA-binding transcription regulator [Catenisphaera adipataccumulans]|jgi:DeoR family deoxyribose operon repressor|uniref:DeoR family deoxyribose operon repressor n=1 Tax=Catenisphaera adipataccumulans TaxID=700500 RepID=A0A7W8CWS9_9FIRM|nr:DeoR/GlpR family DNA-binding transcription regulator [Catenisphaera adipataccumulans]MBB5183042.1 DeoR family deoxyribose operon repressor [Catenisphaera adipataccumulans]
MNKKDLRIQSVVKALAENPNQSAAELAAQFNVSSMTIRRDMQYIDEHHLMDSYLLAEPSEGSYEYQIEEVKNADLKRKIAQAAVKTIKPNEVIVLDSGTTSGMIAALIPNDLPLTVICYSYHILSKLANKKNIRLIMAGGYYHQNTQTFEAPESVEFLHKFRAHKMYVCASGIHESLGLTCADQRVAPSKQAGIDISLKKILVSDSTKFGHISAGFFSSIDNMDMIITDDGITEDWKSLLKDKDIRVEIVQ